MLRRWSIQVLFFLCLSCFNFLSFQAMASNSVVMLFTDQLKVEQMCFNLGIHAEVYSPLYADHLKDQLLSKIDELINLKKRQLNFLNEILPEHPLVLVGQRVLTEIESVKQLIPEMVREIGPRLIISLSRIREILERLNRDSELLEQATRERTYGSRLKLKSSEVQIIVNGWLFCHQNILPDLKSEFGPFTTKKRYRHLVLMPIAKNLAGATDVMTTFIDVQNQMLNGENFSATKWWPKIAAIQRYLSLGEKDKMVEAWRELLHHLRGSERPILLNSLIDWVLAGDSIFNQTQFFTLSIRLYSLREQANVQKRLVEKLGQNLNIVSREVFERERTKMLEMYHDYLSHFMQLAQLSAPYITRLNYIAECKDLLIVATQKYIAK